MSLWLREAFIKAKKSPPGKVGSRSLGSLGNPGVEVGHLLMHQRGPNILFLRTVNTAVVFRVALNKATNHRQGALFKDLLTDFALSAIFAGPLPFKHALDRELFIEIDVKHKELSPKLQQDFELMKISRETIANDVTSAFPVEVRYLSQKKVYDVIVRYQLTGIENLFDACTFGGARLTESADEFTHDDTGVSPVVGKQVVTREFLTTTWTPDESCKYHM